MTQDNPTTDKSNKDEYSITFRNGALKKLKELAKKFDISEDNLDQVVEKGLKVLDLPDDDIIRFKSGGEGYFVDTKDL